MCNYTRMKRKSVHVAWWRDGRLTIMVVRSTAGRVIIKRLLLGWVTECGHVNSLGL